MKVKQKILDLIDKPTMRTAIASRLKVGEQGIAQHMRKNVSNGRMTKMDFLQAISEVTGLQVDEILEVEGAVMTEGAMPLEATNVNPAR